MKENQSTPSQGHTKRLHIPPFITLAWWQVRPTWRLLSIIAIGIILAVAFVCTVPLYSDVTMTAGLRSTLTSPTQNSDIAISTWSEQLNTSAINKNTQSLDTILRKDIGTFINPSHISIYSPQYNLMVPDKKLHGQYIGTDDVISFISAPENSMAQHVTLLHGRLPRSSNNAIFTRLYSTTVTHHYNGYSPLQPDTVVWYYPFHSATISIYNLNQIITDLSHVRTDISFSKNLGDLPFFGQTTPILPDVLLQRFSARVAVVVIPTGGLLVVVVGLLLFFVSLINSIVIERQSETIALLRSRGASRKQVFAVFATQSAILGVIGLLVGPPLAIAFVRFIALFALAPTDRAAVNILSTNLSVIVAKLFLYSLLAVLVAVGTSVATIAQRISSTILSLRHQTARPTARTLLQRMRLDSLAIVIAVVAFVFLQYLLNQGIINTTLNLLLIAPLTLLSIFFLVLASILLFLRLFPLLLRFGASLTMKRRSATPMLALAQMARTPHQSVRTTLLLTLATASLLFLFVFNASQSQRIADVSAYQTGADISGTIRTNGFTAIDRPHITAQYRQLSEVLSASVGYITTASASIGETSQLPMQINAVDSSDFAQTALWPKQNAAHPLSALMQQFIAQRNDVINDGGNNAVVDDVMW